MQVSVDARHAERRHEEGAAAAAARSCACSPRTRRFRVRINTVLGAAPPEEALEVARVAIAHGFDAKCALVRKADGTLAALDERARARLRGDRPARGALARSSRRALSGRAAARRARRLEVPRRRPLLPRLRERAGPPVRPALRRRRARRSTRYGVADLRRAFDERKTCAATCPVAYAHQVSQVDRFRPQPAEEARHPPAPTTPPAPTAPGKHLPVLP